MADDLDGVVHAATSEPPLTAVMLSLIKRLWQFKAPDHTRKANPIYTSADCAHCSDGAYLAVCWLAADRLPALRAQGVAEVLSPEDAKRTIFRGSYSQNCMSVEISADSTSATPCVAIILQY